MMFLLLLWIAGISAQNVVYLAENQVRWTGEAVGVLLSGQDRPKTVPVEMGSSVAKRRNLKKIKLPFHYLTRWGEFETYYAREFPAPC